MHFLYTHGGKPLNASARLIGVELLAVDPNNMGDDAAAREIEVGVVESETVKRYCYCNRRADGSSG